MKPYFAQNFLSKCISKITYFAKYKYFEKKIAIVTKTIGQFFAQLFLFGRIIAWNISWSFFRRYYFHVLLLIVIFFQKNIFWSRIWVLTLVSTAYLFLNLIKTEFSDTWTLFEVKMITTYDDSYDWWKYEQKNLEPLPVVRATQV